MTRTRYRDSRAEIYAQRKRDKLCTYSGRCTAEIEPGRQMCREHLRRAAESNARYRAQGASATEREP